MAKMRAIVIFVGLCLIRKSVQKVEFYEEKATPKDQISCLNTAFRKYFDERRSILLFSTNPNNIVDSLPKIPHQIATELESLKNIPILDKGAVIIFLEGNAERDLNVLKNFLDFMTVQPVLVVCITDAVCSSEMYINKIVKMVNGVKLHYVAVDDRGVIDIYEYTTTVEDNCGIAQLLRRGHCSDESIANQVFHKSVNFHECPLRVATWFCPPYSKPCNYDSNHLCGIEGHVVRSVVEKINATLVPLIVQTPKDVKHLVALRYADLGFGGLHISHHEGSSTSTTYLFTKSSVAAAHSTLTFKGSIRDIILPLQFEVWMGVVAVVALLLILRIVAPSFRRMTALQLFGVMIGIPVLRQPRGFPSRIYFASLLFFGYHFSQLYLANLTKGLSAPRHPRIRTLDDLENSNLRVTGPAIAKNMFKDEYPRIYRDFQLEDYSRYFAKLHELFAGRSSTAFYVEFPDSQDGHWNGVQALDDLISFRPVQMVVPNSSAISKTADKLLSSIVEGGIMQEYLAVASFRDQFPSYNRSKLGSKSLERSLVLDLEELQGVFFLLIGGLVISSFVFLIELMTPFIKSKMQGKMSNGRGEIRPKL